MGRVGTPKLICNPLPRLKLLPLSLRPPTHIYYSQPLFRVISTICTLYNMYHFHPISFKPELLSLTCCMRSGQMWLLHIWV